MDLSTIAGIALLAAGGGKLAYDKLGGSGLRLPFFGKSKAMRRFEAWESLAHEFKDQPTAHKSLDDLLGQITKAEEVE